MRATIGGGYQDEDKELLCGIPVYHDIEGERVVYPRLNLQLT